MSTECQKCGSNCPENGCVRFPYESTVVNDNAEILAAITRLEAKVDQIEGMICTLIPEVKPTIDALTNSPIFRMMTGTKKS